MPASVQGAIDEAAAPAQNAQARVNTAMQLLQEGREDRAKAQLETVLRQQPGNATARQLLDEINADPRVLLGQRSRAYVVGEDDTMSGLAQRFLGDPLMFYALSRYNNLAPNQLTVGRTIQIPERARPLLAPSHPSAATPAPVRDPSAASVGAINADTVARANHLRLRGLEHLNAGDANAAVALLSQAHALDGANAAIQTDLIRAQRIQASLQHHD